MNKFWSVVLKIIIAISILGIVFFVGIAIFKNQNISFEAYNYISQLKNRTDFATLQTEVVNNIKVEFDGDDDEYAKYINSAFIELNEGINYFVDYLALEDSLTKGEQDKLINMYNKYVKSFRASDKRYLEYIKVYEIAEQNKNDYENSDYLRANVRAYAVYFVESYLDCYENGSAFFKYLVQIVNKYTLSNSGFYSYKGQSYMIKCGLVDYSLNFVSQNLKMRLNNELEEYIEDPKTNELINSYYLFLNSSTKFSDASSVNNTSFKNFINNLNTLNIFEWAGNYDLYVSSLSEELTQNASSALDFYNNNFKE